MLFYKVKPIIQLIALALTAFGCYTIFKLLF
jgi:hypothetical protein